MQVGDHNTQHWWIATQDKILQSQLSKIPGVPVVFASVNGLHLSGPPERAVAAVAQGHADAQVVPAHERVTEALRDLDELKQKDDSYKAFRRKKARGPNPLAVRKKAKKKSQQAEGSSRKPEQEAAVSSQQETKLKKARKRKKGKSNPDMAAS